MIVMGRNTIRPVISVIRIKIDPKEAAGIFADALDVLAVERKTLLGFLAAQILLSVDNKTMVVMTEWSDRRRSVFSTGGATSPWSADAREVDPSGY